MTSTQRTQPATFSNSMMAPGDSRNVNGTIVRNWQVILGMLAGLNPPRFSTHYWASGQADGI
jgi:hypothetical protein